MYYNDDAQESYENYQKEYKSMLDFYSANFSTREKEFILFFHQENLTKMLKMLKKDKRNIFDLPIDSNGDFFIELSLSLYLFALRTEQKKKINFYENFIKIAFKKTSQNSLVKKYTSGSIKANDMFVAVMNILSHTNNQTPFFNLFNHYSDLFLLNQARVDYVFKNYMNDIFKNKDIYNFFNKEKYIKNFYPSDKDHFNEILESLIENESVYSENEIFEFIQNCGNQGSDFLNEILDETGPVSVLLECFENTNSHKTIDVIKHIIVSESQFLITEEDEKHPIIKSLRENISLKSMIDESSLERESSKLNKRL